MKKPKTSKASKKRESDINPADLSPFPPSTLSMLDDDHTNLMDVQIAVCKLFNLTHIQTAATIRTPDAPSGVSEATVTRHIASNSNWIESFIEWATPLRRNSRTPTFVDETKPLTPAELRADMESSVASSWALVRAEILDGNIDLALWHIEQVIGKASQPHKITGNVSVDHNLIWQPEKYLITQERDMMTSDRLLAALPPAVLEAELVASNGNEVELTKVASSSPSSSP